MGASVEDSANGAATAVRGRLARARAGLGPFGWKASSWAVAALLSAMAPVAVVGWALPAGMQMTSSFLGVPTGDLSNVGLIFAGATLLGAGVFTGFACWAGALACRWAWRTRERMLASVLAPSPTRAAAVADTTTGTGTGTTKRKAGTR